MKPTRPAPKPASPVVDQQRVAPVPIEHPKAPKASRRPHSLSRKLRPNKKALLIISVTLTLIILAFLIYHVTRPDASVATPNYPTVLPNGKSINTLGGWKRVSPPKSDPVFSYTDSVDGVPISISEQPLPKAFIEDVDGQVAELAKKFNATNKLTAGSTTVYIGTSSKGPQSIIFTKNNLLILIKSEKIVANSSWVNYIASLR